MRSSLVTITCPGCAQPVQVPVEIQTLMDVTEKPGTIEVRFKIVHVPHACPDPAQDRRGIAITGP